MMHRGQDCNDIKESFGYKNVRRGFRKFYPLNKRKGNTL